MQKSGLGILIAAAAAYAYYRYTKMSPAEKSSLKEKGKKMVSENLGLGNIFNRHNRTAEV